MRPKIRANGINLIGSAFIIPLIIYRLYVKKGRNS